MELHFYFLCFWQNKHRIFRTRKEQVSKPRVRWSTLLNPSGFLNNYSRKWGETLGKIQVNLSVWQRLLPISRGHLRGWPGFFLVWKTWLEADTATLPLAYDEKFPFLYFQGLKYRYAPPLRPYLRGYWGSICIWCLKCFALSDRK